MSSETWTCGECGATSDYQPEFDGDLPQGWFRVEDSAVASPVCSTRCLMTFAQGSATPAVSEIVHELAEFDPFEIVGTHQECFFCCEGPGTAHKPDCLWLLAQSASKLPALSATPAVIAEVVKEMREWQGKRPGYTDNDLVAIEQWADRLARLLPENQKEK